MKQDLREKILKMLRAQPVSELPYIKGRYCGPSNEILCYKKFGYHIPIKLVDEVLHERAFEEIVLGAPKSE